MKTAYDSVATNYWNTSILFSINIMTVERREAQCAQTWKKTKFHFSACAEEM